MHVAPASRTPYRPAPCMHSGRRPTHRQAGEQRRAVQMGKSCTLDGARGCAMHWSSSRIPGAGVVPVAVHRVEVQDVVLCCAVPGVVWWCLMKVGKTRRGVKCIFSDLLKGYRPTVH